MYEHGNQLVDNLWQIVVEGECCLQDLIYSTITNPKDLTKLDKTNPAVALSRKEIRNGIITSRIWKVLTAVASNQEMKTIRDLNVVTACCYMRSDKVNNVDEWIKTIIGESGSYISNGSKVNDGRSNVWCSIPLSSFLDKLVNERKICKERSKVASTEDERNSATARDKVLKLIINTTYGAIASHYFRIGNVVVANNITGIARASVWMLAKALDGKQSITDGVHFSPSQVCSYTSFRPSLKTFADMKKWRSHRQRKYVSIVCNDESITQHINSFWNPYGLDFPHSLGIKDLWNKVSWMAKGDYVYESKKGSTMVRIRGRGKEHEVLWLKNILNSSDEVPFDFTTKHRGLLKIGQWLHIQNSNGYERLKNLRPGDNFVDNDGVARYNNLHCPIDSIKDFVARSTRRHKNRDKLVPLFERFASKGTKFLHGKMMKNMLR
jgi:hypothetical protein